MSAFEDVVYDIRLSCFSFVRYLREYGLTRTSSWQAAVLDYYEILMNLDLPENKKWKDFLPEGLPTTNFKEWLIEANRFLDDPDGYPIDYTPEYSKGWKDANTINGAVNIIPDLLWNVAETMNLCDVYDQVWPLIIRNYRDMPKLSAPYGRDFPLDWEFGIVAPNFALEENAPESLA